jgi:quercetin dioxygenase-like cupin family protein
MAIRRVAAGDGVRRRPPFAGAPFAEVLVGADGDWPVAVLHVTVPPRGAMPEHAHGASETVVTPLEGSVRITEAGAGGTIVDLEPGALATIPEGERVRLDNPTDEEAVVLVVLSPPDFATHVRSWPEVVAAI